MKRFSIFFSLVLIGVGAGCGKSTSSAKTDPQALAQAFGGTPAEVQQAAKDASTALQQHNPVAAYQELNRLQSRRDLTPQQQAEAGRSMTLALQQMQAAAQTGDPQARQALEQYRRSK